MLSFWNNFQRWTNWFLLFYSYLLHFFSFGDIFSWWCFGVPGPVDGSWDDRHHRVRRRGWLIPLQPVTPPSSPPPQLTHQFCSHQLLHGSSPARGLPTTLLPTTFPTQSPPPAPTLGRRLARRHGLPGRPLQSDSQHLPPDGTGGGPSLQSTDCCRWQARCAEALRLRPSCCKYLLFFFFLPGG